MKIRVGQIRKQIKGLLSTDEVIFSDGKFTKIKKDRPKKFCRIEAKKLREQGLSYAKIGKMLCVAGESIYQALKK